MLAQRNRAALSLGRLSASGRDAGGTDRGLDLRRRTCRWVFLRLGSTDAFVCVVVDGLIRAFLTSAGGRQMTVRCSRPGDIIGATTVYPRQLTTALCRRSNDSTVWC
jgi:CRP-like cAMP-binding protein